jgi:hypothetical protein
VLRQELSGPTRDAQVLEATAGAPWPNVRYVRIETVSSVSFVAWREVEVLGG